MSEKKKVMVFGTYDILHPGHEFFLKEAAGLGELHVVVARDQTVHQVKGRLPQNDEQLRMKKLLLLPYIKNVYLGNTDDKYRIIEDIHPDIIFLGYDQLVFTDKLEEELNKRKLEIKIIRTKNSYLPEKYKSSKLRST